MIHEKGYPLFSPQDEQNFSYEEWLGQAIQTSSAEVLILDVRDDLPRGLLKKLNIELQEKIKSWRELPKVGYWEYDSTL